MEVRELGGYLHRFSEVYLYGAGVVAYGAYRAVRELFGITVKGFLVTDKNKQPVQIEGIPVCAVKEITPDRKSSLIVIAAPEEYHASMERELADRGLSCYLNLDSHMEYVLMGAYLKKTADLKLIEECQDTGRSGSYGDIGIYMAVSHKDKALAGNYPELPWVKRIQAGAALTDIRISALTDEGDDSISEQNDRYGELTAAYYAWKYSRYDVTGLFHYRRILHLTREQLGFLQGGNIDVVLPLPFVCYPDASGQYGRYILPEDADIMLGALEQYEGRSFGEIKALLGGPYLYNYNLLVARKEAFHDYCSWLFHLLKEITYRCEKEKRNRMPRYIGRIGEVLTSVYFMQNVKRWNIVHGEKIWRV